MAGSAQAPNRCTGSKGRFRSAALLVLVGLIFVYELVWKGSLLADGSLAARVIDIGLILFLAFAVAWWRGETTRELLKRLAREEAASEEKGRLLEQRNLQLQAVLQASRTLAPVQEETQVAAQALAQVQQYTRFTRLALVAGPDEQGCYRALGSSGMNPSHLQRLVEASDGEQRVASPVAWCSLTRQPVVVENLARDFRTSGLKELWSAMGVEAMMAAPLLAQDEFRGALLLFLEKSGPVATPEISLVSALTGQTAIYLENARRFARAEQDRDQLDKTVLLFESMASALASTRVGVSPFLQFVADAAARLVAPARIQLIITGPARLSPMAVTRSAGLEQVKPEDLRQVLTLPVTLDGDEIGRMEVYLAGENRTPDGETTGILRTLGHLIASALGNSSLLSHLRQAVDEAERAYMGTLEALSKALEMRDHEVEGHSRRVVQITIALARQMNLPEHLMVPIIRGALLHDIGKIGIPDAILRKPAPLNEEEWTVMRQHPRIGYEMLKQIDFLKQAVPVILHHHERYDGTGYPAGLAEERIPIGARIFSVADTYDAITSHRPYREGRSHQEAVAEITRASGSQFDPQVVEALLLIPGEDLARIRESRPELVR